jgi:hypothetical protein
VVERGTHAELLAAGGAYARLWAMQARHGAADAAAMVHADALPERP